MPDGKRPTPPQDHEFSRWYSLGSQVIDHRDIEKEVKAWTEKVRKKYRAPTRQV